ncbi:hypothetical protein FYJ34_09455 [Clostridiaceae bacterium 68-1-5]|uniref:Uncharacterized protein n=1 Tax=Suipraeoptans intestinalis TaxID=2606628 RepID=A0A6N7V3I6_9FIRM|nr:hypothetical protein [Suipraeoptans intestinalis]MSR94476.1 hypothetical protein [Suipraeoptans intestinalis]
MKRLKILAGMTLAVAGCLLATPKVFAEESYNIHYEYVEESSLTEAEKALIRTGDVNETVQSDADVKLIYKAKDVCELPEDPKDPTPEDPKNPTPETPQTPGTPGKTTEKVSGQPKITKASKEKDRPKTGDASRVPGVFALCVGSGAVIFVTVRKRKLAAGGLALAIVLSSLSAPAIFAKDAMLAELPKEGKTLQSGSQVTYKPEKVRCYDYVGYIIQSKTQGKIIARYFLGTPEDSVQLREKLLREGDAGSPTGGKEQVENEATAYLGSIGITDVAVPLSPEEKAEFISSYKKIAEEAIALVDEVRPNKDFYNNYDESYKRILRWKDEIDKQAADMEVYKFKDSITGFWGLGTGVTGGMFSNEKGFLMASPGLSQGYLVTGVDIQPDAAGNSTVLRKLQEKSDTYPTFSKNNRQYVEQLSIIVPLPVKESRYFFFDMGALGEMKYSREVKKELEEGTTYIDFYLGNVTGYQDQ